MIVAHPDDETLWAGGTMLFNPTWNWVVISLCRKNDEDRAKKFSQALLQLHAIGVMGDLDDGPDQHPLPAEEVEQMILALLPSTSFDLILTHDPQGEYTRHLRHEEASRAVINLWNSGRIKTKDLWLFAYDDHQKAHYPTAIETAPLYRPLSDSIWTKKHLIITDTYGFAPDSWEAQATPRAEAFWQFNHPGDAKNWITHHPPRI